MTTRFGFFMAFSAFVFLLSASGAGAAGVIDWRLENPFRMFLDPDATKMHMDAYRDLNEYEREQPVLSVERKLADKYRLGWSEAVYNKTCWDEKRNGYRFCHKKGLDYINPKKHRVMVRYTGDAAADDRCDWRLISMKGRKGRQLAHKKAACDREVGFDVPYPTGARVSVRVNGGKRSIAKIRVKDAFIVGVGDSFASGEGNPDVPVQFTDKRSIGYGLDPNKKPLQGYPTRKGEWTRFSDVGFLREAARWQSRACHRSLYSWQVRAALQLALENPKRAVTFVGFACSGSQITVGLFLQYVGNEWDRHPPQLPQLSYVSEELCGKSPTKPKDYTSGYSQLGKLPELENMILNKCYKPKRKIDLLLVSIGGNDVNFSSLVANAILADKGVLKRMGGWMGSVQDADGSRKLLGRLATRYKALNKAFHYMLRIPWKQSDRIIMTAYPRMSYQEDGASLCPGGQAGMDLYHDFSAIKFRLKEGERFADELYKQMKKSSRRYGWTFVDEHRERFAPHGFCAVDPLRGQGTNEFLALPRMNDDKWAPYKPAAYKAYGRRQRWFRTPNDGFMTGNFHFLSKVSKRILSNKRLKWFQIVMAGTYSGSFHPTAEGHAAIADAVVRKARNVLKKYGK